MTSLNITKSIDRSKELFNNRYLCAESVLIAIAEYLDIKSDIIPKIATGFCSGIARTCGQCGAVSGAIMGLGLALGRNSSNESTDEVYQKTQVFLAKFEASHQSTNCQVLTEVDLGTEEGRAQFKAENKFPLCEGFVQDATRIALELLDD